MQGIFRSHHHGVRLGRFWYGSLPPTCSNRK